MSLQNSSTSSSEPETTEPAAKPRGWGDCIIVSLWVVVFLGIYDVATAAMIRRPIPQKIQRFFNYGLSIEEKIAIAVGLRSEPVSVIARLGFLDPPPDQGQPSKRRPDSPLFVASYGMSFSADLTVGMSNADPSITTRILVAPSAPPNHAYAGYLRDRGRHDADVVMLGVLASSVPGLLTRSMTWYFVSPYPYTYPRYFLDGQGGIKESPPLFGSFEKFRKAMDKPEEWEPFVAQTKADDPFYSDFLFRHNVTDHSVLASLVRKAWSQRLEQSVTATFHTEHGYDPDSEVIRVLRVMLVRFAEQVRADGKLPMVLLLNDRGYEDHLFRAVGPELEKAGVPFMSTHSVRSSSDPKNLLLDNHFTPESNLEFGREVLRIIEVERTKARPIP